MAMRAQRRKAKVKPLTKDVVVVPLRYYSELTDI
jgi:hypothetical protein